MSKPNTSRVSAVGKAHDDKLAEIMSARDSKVWNEGYAAGLATGLHMARLSCRTLHRDTDKGNPERANGAMDCSVAIEKLIRREEA